MAAFTTTEQTFQAIGNREELADVIYNISPTDTPYMTNVGKGSVNAVLTEWQIDSLATAVSTNQQIQGDDITQTATANVTSRVGCHTAISRKTVTVAATQEAVNKAGRNSDIAYNVMKLSKEIKRDMEKGFCENLADSAGNATTASVTPGLGAWIKSGDVLGSGGASPSYTSTPNAARTDGTQRDITEALFKQTANLVWTNGGELKMVMSGPVNKQNISKFSGIATRFTDTGSASPTTIVGAADFYVTDFGRVSIVPNRFQRERDVWFIDPAYAQIGYLRPFSVVPLAKTGDAEKRMLIVEYANKCLNEAAHGLLADLNTTVL